MQEDMIFSILILVLIFVVFAYTTVRDAIKKNRRFLEHAKKFWGKVPDREYTYEEFRSISDYARRRKGEDFFIDDITWNDLDMDQIFMLANNTVSSCGEEYLYEMLRKPLFDQEKLDERNRLIEFFRTNEDTRIKVQKMLAKIGKTYGISLGEYIYRLQDVPRKSNRKYILLAAAMLFSLVSLFFMPVVGIIGILVLMVYNMILHTRE
ncbi:MAG: DNA mismatch repair protein MutS, partial [Lachnospiraceae bacterium]|nr:DNA mismatch repair protein MutS [Lachnospiraceae bacterium]